MNPFEAMFVKVKSLCLSGARQCSDAAESALTYDRFISQKVQYTTSNHTPFGYNIPKTLNNQSLVPIRY